MGEERQKRLNELLARLKRMGEVPENAVLNDSNLPQSPPGSPLPYRNVKMETFPVSHVSASMPTLEILPEEFKTLLVMESHVQDCLETLYRKGLKSEVKLELGTCTGHSTHALLLSCKYGRGHLWSVDTEPCLMAVDRMKKNNLDKYWTFTIMHDLEYVRSWNKEIDLLFIDSGHSFDLTLSELEAYSPFIKSDGVIFLHDTVACPAVKEAISEFIKRHPKWTYMEIPTFNGLGKLARSGGE